MNIPTPTPSEYGPSPPFRNHKDVMPFRAESLGSQEKPRSESVIDGWEDDGGSVAEADAAWPTFNLYG
jgi:hypothetical protein